MAVLTPFPLEAAREVASTFGIDVLEVEALHCGSVNSNFSIRCRGGRRYFGRIYEEQGAEGAAREHALLRALSNAGVPCAVPVDSHVPLEPDGRGPSVPLFAGKPVAFYPWIMGEIVCFQRCTTAHLHAVGVALARVHRTASVGLGAGRFGVEPLLERLGRVEREASAQSGRSGLLADAARVRERLAFHGERRATDLPHGVVHGDLFRDNVLWQGSSIVALLDFESASDGPLLYDLMVCVLAWCFGDGFVAERVAALLAGYESVRPLVPAERAGLRAEAALAALRFAVTRMTDFELRTPAGQVPGRDYRRFLARLDAIEAGALDALCG